MVLCETNGLPVPADVEHRDRGLRRPVADRAGRALARADHALHARTRAQQPVFEVTAITMRRDPIYRNHHDDPVHRPPGAAAALAGGDPLRADPRDGRAGARGRLRAGRRRDAASPADRAARRRPGEGRAARRDGVVHEQQARRRRRSRHRHLLRSATSSTRSRRASTRRATSSSSTARAAGSSTRAPGLWSTRIPPPRHSRFPAVGSRWGIDATKPPAYRPERADYDRAWPIDWAETKLEDYL